MSSAASVAEGPRRRPDAPRSHRTPRAFAGLVLGSALIAGTIVGLGADHTVLMLVALLAAVTLVTLLAWPEAALPLALFLVWANVGSVVVGRGTPFVLGAAIPLILMVPLIAQFLRGERLVADRVFACLVVLLVVAIASTATSAYPAAGIGRVASLASEGVLIYLLVYNVARTPESLRRAAWALLAAGAFLAMVTVVQNVTQTFDRPYFGFSALDRAYFLGKSDVARAHGPVADPNYYAQILVATIALGLARLRGARSMAGRVLVVGAIVVMVVAVAFTYSRGAVLALAVVALTMLFLGYLKLRHLALVGVAAVVLVLAVPGYGDRIASIGAIGGATAQPGIESGADESSRSRATENLAALLVFRDHPLLGVGPGAFGFYYQEYAARTGGTVHRPTKTGAGGSAPGETPTREAHNLFLGAAADQGLMGLLAICAVLGFAIGGLIRARRRLSRRDMDFVHTITGMLLALVAYVSAGLFLSLAFERFLWVLVALAGAAASVARRMERRRA